MLDATGTALSAGARQSLIQALEIAPADPTRLYGDGRRARARLDGSRAVLAEGLGVRPEEVSLLPSGPEALVRAVEGLLHAARRRGTRTVASAVEHSALLLGARARAAADPGLLGEVQVDRVGRVDLGQWERALAVPGTVVAALQSANGEVGTRQPLAEARALCQRNGVPLLVDASASLGRDEVPTDFDVLVGDARTWGGPPLGVLVVRENVRWYWPSARAQVEHGRAEVTPWLPLALAAAEAWAETAAQRVADADRASALISQVRAAAALVPDTEVMGDAVDRLPHVVTFSSLFVDGEVLVEAFDRQGFEVASGSACTSSTLEPSHVLAAMGVLTHGNVRLTLPLESVSPGRADDVSAFTRALAPTVAAVRARTGVSGL